MDQPARGDTRNYAVVAATASEAPNSDSMMLHTNAVLYIGNCTLDMRSVQPNVLLNITPIPQM